MDEKVVNLLKKGGIGVIPTDTIYGIVGSALNSQTVEKIYQLRKRSSNKPMIVLISSLNDLKKFDVSLTRKQAEFLKKIWPNPISVVLPCISAKFKYLHRNTNSLAFRMPRNEDLLKLLSETGPLVAPSANFEGEKPAESIAVAKKYFGRNMDFYVDGGEIISRPSTIIGLAGDSVKVFRHGEFKFNFKLQQDLSRIGLHLG